VIHIKDIMRIFDLFFSWMFVLSCVVVGFAVLITLTLVCINVGFVAVGAISDFIIQILF
jgi:hypothetical protein